MEEKINQALNEELLRQIEGLADFETGAREMSGAVDDVVKLHNLYESNEKLAVEKRKLALEESKMKHDSEQNEQHEKTTLAEQKKDRYVRIGITAAEIVIPLIFSGIWFARGLRFEEKGSYTSKTPQTVNAFQNFANKFRKNR